MKWPAANGQGNTIARYAVTASLGGRRTRRPASRRRRSWWCPAGELEYGTQYAFTVVAVNEQGRRVGGVAGQQHAWCRSRRPVGRVDLRAGTVADQPGAVTVQWAPAEANGRPVTKYLVDVGGRRQRGDRHPHDASPGWATARTSTVKVKAVNEAGPGPEATATARTVAEPRVTVTGSSSTATAATVTFTVDAGGGQATCALSTAGEPAKAGGVLQHHDDGPDAGHRRTRSR